MLETSDCALDSAPEAVRRARDAHQPADRRIRDIYEGRAAWGALPAAIQQKTRAVYGTLNDDANAMLAWQTLLNHLGHDTGLLAVEPVMPSLGPQSGNTGMDALLHLALRRAQWLRSPEDWLPETEDTRQQISSLARHLLCRYPVPAFLDAAWFEGFSPAGAQHRDWFVHVGVGQNIRRAPNLPFRLTEKAAHHFLQAPDDFSIVGALRWGQTLALGGDEFLARAIAESRLESILPDELFWESVIHFFVNNPAMNAAQVGPIVDYLWTQKFGETCRPDANGVWDNSDAPEPTFTMKGRKLSALQKRVEEWHEFLAKESKRPKSAWEPSGIAPFSAQERDSNGTPNVWAIVELLSSTALQEEGREMRHCVFTYAPNCLNGKISLWSVRVRTPGEARNRRLLTIEVNMTRRAIVQARGKANQTLGQMKRKARGKAASEIVRRWAREQRLSVACGV